MTITSNGTTAATGTFLQGIQALTFTQAVTLNNADLTFGATAPGINVPITFTGTTTLVGPSTLTITDTGGVYFNGQVTDEWQRRQRRQPGLAGAGTVFLTNPSANNNFTGGTLLAGTATVVVSDASALGSGTIGFNGTSAVSQLVVNTAITFTNPYVVIGGFMTIVGTTSTANVTFSGPGTLAASTTLTDNDLGTLTLSGNLGEAGALAR